MPNSLFIHFILSFVVMASEILNFGSCVIKGLPRCALVCVCVGERERIKDEYQQMSQNDIMMRFATKCHRLLNREKKLRFKKKKKRKKPTDVSNHRIMTVGPLRYLKYGLAVCYLTG